MVLALFFFLVAIASALSFFIGYTFNSAAEGFVFPHPYPFMYVRYILITFATFCGIRGSDVALYIVGVPVVCFMIYLVAKAVSDVVRHTPEASDKNSDRKIAVHQIIIVLVTFTLLFVLNLAVGRVCLGLETASSSRYQTYLIPGFFALYLFAVTRRNVPFRWIAFCMACFFITTFSLGTSATAYFQNVYQGKQKWKQAYLQTEDILLSDQLSGFSIHPNPHYTHLKEKLNYLKEHHLNLYLEESE
ncbi:MAG: hypothetical protein D3922_05570 [Candidatus Electrothrix sp. AR1]|nr:hypothetical protein [Candidatus Electrothrix sp. AR1]